MCMYIKNQDIKPLIAEEDITCYKVMIREDNGQLISMVKDFPYELNKTYHSEIGLRNFTTLLKGYIISTVEEGFHSYKDIKNATLDYVCYLSGGTVMVKCIIPKGSIYYKGYNTITKDITTCSTMEEVEKFYAYETYVSDSIIIKEIVDEPDIPFPYKKTGTVTVEINDRLGNKVLLDMKVIGLGEFRGNIEMRLSELDDTSYFSKMNFIVDIHSHQLLQIILK